MKSILSKILIVVLVASFFTGLSDFNNVQAKVIPSSSNEFVNLVPVVSTPKLMPEVVIAQPIAACNVSLGIQNNLVQTAGAVNLNQFADCFSISVDYAPQLPDLAIAQPLTLPELSVANTPSWSPDRITESAGQASIPAIAVNFLLAILLFALTKGVKQIVVSTRKVLNVRSEPVLSELQVFRC